MRSTDISVRALKAPDNGQKTYTDDSLPGFGVRVSQGGTKTFVVVHGPTRERTTIGRFPTISLSEARTEAKRILAEATLGKHRPKTVTFDEAKKRYLEVCEKKNRPGTVREHRRLLRHFAFGRTNLADIAKRDVVKKLDKLKDAPSEQHHARVAIKVFFRWTVGQDYLAYSPCEGLRAASKPGSRTRVLSAEELGTVLAASLKTPYPYGAIVALCILTGQRKGEIGHLEWEWFDRVDRTVTLPEWLTKNKRKHLFPYGDMLAALLKALPIVDNARYLFPAAKSHIRGKPTTVFNGWSKAKAEFYSKLEGVRPFTLHDLRRTVSSHMAKLGIEQLVVEKLLNHVSGGTQSPIAQVYNQYSYFNEMQVAIEKWDTYLATLLPK
ncbi:site-specific integrase [Mesorhizobium sp. M2D.F.Ca.ET.223.01.1.1]|uniref:tyrosine-type recombinase/integrase n=1 Tax=Mesorhizobium sp. M2D.F.Ca.ET.223.01.1.1 TaxID=2563940 RepID=UPI0010930928|nr:site-specific integrase [Mesorhizobium sp. M2D.F.Ca.ET.223.01.1.1]TGR82787.1 site-specific integrase [Mesorhizobium sp. M2D.F.Ca.ET.223.01.1.1]